jgi:hypothetical protein
MMNPLPRSIRETVNERYNKDSLLKPAAVHP